MSPESRRTVDETFDSDESTDAFQITGGRLELGEGIEGTEPCRFITLLDSQFRTKPSNERHDTSAPRELPGGEDE